MIKPIEAFLPVNPAGVTLIFNAGVMVILFHPFGLFYRIADFVFITCEYLQVYHT